MARARILTTKEQEAFDKPPLFDHRERKQFFSFTKGVMDMAVIAVAFIGVVKVAFDTV